MTSCPNCGNLTENTPRRRWFQVSLKTLLVVMLVVAAFFGGYRVAQRQAEKALREAREEAEAALEASRKQEASAAEQLARQAAFNYLMRVQAAQQAAQEPNKP